MRKRSYLLLLFLAVFLLSSCTTSNPPQSLGVSYQETKDLTIEIRGEVEFPGLYQIQAGSLLYQVIELAGGCTDRADLSGLVLVTPILENQLILIPSKLGTDTPNGSNKMKLNQVTKAELLTIPGVGATKAEAIINYRNQVGSFKSLDDLLKVSGIGPSLLHTLKEYLTL